MWLLGSYFLPQCMMILEHFRVLPLLRLVHCWLLWHKDLRSFFVCAGVRLLLYLRVPKLLTWITLWDSPLLAFALNVLEHVSQ